MPTEAGPPRHARREATATRSKSPRPPGRSWLCWRRRRANPKRHCNDVHGDFDDAHGELTLNALKEIDFKRFANVVARQIFDRGLDTNLILVRAPGFQRRGLKDPMALFVREFNVAFH